MYIRSADPHPGRCKNFREVADGQTERCLEAEGTHHVCRFAEPWIKVSDGPGWGGNINVYETQQPKPWVVPPKKLIDICMIPDCGCDGKAHP